LIKNIDERYIVFDGNNKEYFLEFEDLPELEQGHDREIGIIVNGYFIRKRIRK